MPVKMFILILCAKMLSGCMAVTINNWADHNSTVTCTTNQAKPIHASPYVRTTGEDVGQAMSGGIGETVDLMDEEHK